MKNKHTIVLIVLSIILINSCQKEKLTTYNEKSRVYFELRNAVEYTRYPGSYAQKLHIAFGEKPDTVLTDTLHLRLFSTGPLSDVSRTIELQMQAALDPVENGKDYEILNKQVEIAPGKIDTTVNLVFHRSQRIYDDAITFGIKLHENSLFQLGPLHDTIPATKRFTDIQFKISDIVSKPKNWDSFLAKYFLGYSAIKYRFIINTLKVSQFDSKTTDSNMKAFRTKLIAALEAYEIKHGKTLIDENGNEVKFN